ncbi:MAG: ribosome-binding factor [Bacteroidota bacterium]|nr:ribosome-binding factor [Bacteroidota bacterium]
MSIRSEKVASLIKRVIAGPINDLANEHSAGLVTVTSVRLSKDLQIANIYVSIFGNKFSPGKFLAILEDKKGAIRTAVGANVRLRFTPEIRFFLDDTLDQIEHIQDILNSVQKDSKETKVNMDDYVEKELKRVKS